MQKILTVDPIDALKMSIQSEKEMQAYYLKAASLVTDDDDAKTILLGLANHADLHRQDSIDMYSKISGKKILFLNLDKRHKLTSLQRCPDDILDAVRIAKRNERELSDFYGTISRRFMQQNLRTYFRTMAADNMQHLTLLEASFEDWFSEENVESEEHILDHATHEN